MGKIFHRIRTRKDGSRYVDPLFHIRYYDPARRMTVTEATGTDNPKKALKQLRDRETKKDKGEIILPKATRTTMAELFDFVLIDKQNNKRKSAEIERQRIEKHLLPFFQRYRAIQITYEVIEQYKRLRLDAGAQNGTVNRELATVRRAFRLGLRSGRILMLPRMDFLKEDNVRKGFFDEELIQKLLAELPEELRPLVVFAYFTGMREGEVINLLWDQLDRHNCVIRLETSKNGEPRELWYSENEEIRNLIESQWQKRAEIEKATGRKVEYLFFRYPGTGRGTRPGDKIKDFRGAFNKALGDAEIETYEYIKNGQRIRQKRIFHDFRRTAVRNLRRVGVPESVAMMISGHESRSVFERYNIRDPKETRAALGKVKFERQIERQMEKPAKETVYKPVVFVESSTRNSKRESGGIGRRAGLRIQSRKGWGFESPLSHSKKPRRHQDTKVARNNK